MKKYSGVINIILLLAVLVLYYLHFSSETQGAEVKEEIRVEPKNQTPPEKGSLVYVDIEKLLLEYQYSIDLNNEFLKEKDRLEGELRREVEKYEVKAKAYQNKLSRGGFISNASAENQKAELITQQQEIESLRSSLELEWYEKEKELQDKLYDAIIAYIEELCIKNNYQYVLSKSVGSNILYGARELNITEQVIADLNETYVKTEK